MLKRGMLMAGVIIAGIAIFSLVYKVSEVETFRANKTESESLVTKEELHRSTLEKITEKLHEKYVGVGVKTTPNKELVLQVVGDEEYFNSVKKDIESIAKSVIQTSVFKDYTVVFERWDLVGDATKIFNERHNIISTLRDGLKVYDVIGDISADYQKSSIIIHTSIKGSDQKAQQLALEIKEAVNKILLSKDQNSESNIEGYNIKIVNTKGEEIK